jgi:predicted  nucleic acid-binding Zn-ribbon protein
VLEDLRLLVELQGLDRRVHELEMNRERLPRLVEIAGENYRAVESEMMAAEAELESVSKEKRSADSELAAENEHIRKLKLRSTEIKTNKEYFAHLKEIEDCQKKITKLEEWALELMEKIEKAEAALAGKKSALDAERERFEAQKVEIEKGFSDGDAELAQLKEKRADLLPRIKKEDAEYYRSMQQKFPDSAVVETVNGNCTGCRMKIPPQLYNNVRKGEGIFKCSQCRRILFYKEA